VFGGWFRCTLGSLRMKFWRESGINVGRLTSDERNNYKCILFNDGWIDIVYVWMLQRCIGSCPSRAQVGSK
jgi:hypothetical protein